MARLNDPPAPPPESIDALKRRFIRQNREIARANSTQSLRIRNLETEISRLLGENISLREQAINSAQEAERWRSSHKLITEVGQLKDKLEAKLSEVNTLVTELGTLPEKAARRSSYRSKSILVETVKSPDQKEWRNRQTIGGVLAGERELQEGRLPAIHEGKFYPRKTMEGREIQRLVEGDVEASESPDLGPPPVAHFDVPDPIKFEPQRTVVKDHALSTEEEEVMVNNANLETRRKRRPSALLESAPVLHPSPTEAPIEAANNDVILKSGSKRKLSVRDDDENNRRSENADDFTFQRKSITSNAPLPRNRGSRFVRPSVKQATQSVVEEPVPSPQKKDLPVRKVLAPRSTNSPAKIRRPNINEKIAALKDDVAKDAAATRSTRQDRRQSVAPVTVVPKPIEEIEKVPVEGEAVAIDLPPKTPAGLDLFSPVSTEPSTRSNAHPTEMAITTSVEDILGNAARGSRRARAAVSYAEPNLRDKMRRPGKEFVAAVEGIDQFKHREGSAQADGVDNKHVTEDVVKNEQSVNDSTAWKNLPHTKDEAPSPLKEKSARLSDESRGIQEGTGNAIFEPSVMETAISRLSIYDGPISSPHDGKDTNSSSPIEVESVPSTITTTFKTRRHSSNPASSRLGDQPIHKTLSTERQQPRQQPRPASSAAVASQRAEPTRPSSAAGHRAEKLVARPGSATELRRAGDSSRQAAAVELKRSTSVAALEDASGRTERAASRRRSMMV